MLGGRIKRGCRRNPQLNVWRTGISLLFILTTTSASCATLEISAPRLIHQPVLLFLEPENKAAEQPLPSDTAQARISSVMLAFDPPLQVLPVGTTIDVVNEDPILHNTHVFDRNRTLFNVATPTTAIAVQRKLTRPGLFGVRCDLHPSMNAWIAIVRDRHYAVIEKPGIFTIEDIAPGHYALHIQRPDKQNQVLMLDMGAKERRRIRLSP